MKELLKQKAKQFMRKKIWMWIIGLFTGASLASLLVIGALALVLTLSLIFLGGSHKGWEKDQASTYDLCIDGDSGGSISQSVIQNVFEKNAKGGKLEGKGTFIVKTAEKYKVPPKIAIAIIAMESGWGKGANATIQNNPFSVMGNATIHDSTFPAIEDGIVAGIKNLYDLYISEGLNTPEKIGPKYAPVGASNDPTNLNANWIPAVKQTIGTLSSPGDSTASDSNKDKDKKEETVDTDCGDVPAGMTLEKLKKYNGNLPKYSGKRFEPNTYSYLQCTWYVYNRRKELGLPVELTFGNGADWPSRAKSQGYKVGKKPMVGAMVSWPYNSIQFGSTTYGHIAFVEAVYKDGRIKVSEHNVIPFTYGERTFQPPSDLTYIY